MKTSRTQLLQSLKPGISYKTAELVKVLKISRQRVAALLKDHVDNGVLVKSGSTKTASYQLASKKINAPPTQVKLIKNLKNLEEGKVFDELDLRLNLKSSLQQNVYKILTYAFEEMLNNAIDHSQSKKVTILVNVDNKNAFFTIKDLGIGIFANIQKGFKLANEYEALEHLLKGKQTTYPERHSGQGIFFTSKIADEFIIRSHKISTVFENKNNDLRTAESKYTRGTEVSFTINRYSKKKLLDLFKKYADENFEFDRTRIKVQLTAERELLSRSQARRILFGLQDYKIVILDFKKVKEIGQAFVDEIFRVYQIKNPDVRIEYINANDAIHFMIRRGTNS